MNGIHAKRNLIVKLSIKPDYLHLVTPFCENSGHYLWYMCKFIKI